MSSRKAKQTNPAERMRIEYVPLSEVAKWPRNPKLHADAELDESLERFGFVAPAIRDERTKRLVAGHGRLERLTSWKSQGKPAPKRVEVAPDGEWLMPVVCGVAFTNEQEAEAYLLADNQITLLRGWDGPKLQAIGEDLINGAGLLGTGFDEDSIRAEMEKRTEGALGNIGGAEGSGPPANGTLSGELVDDGPEVNPTEELRKKWGTDVGQFWEIISADGSRVHRLAVGDSTDPARMTRLMGGEKAKLLKTDPPYGVNYTAVKAGMPVSGLGTAQKRFGDIKDDDLNEDGLVELLMRLWAASEPHLGRGVAVYAWHPDSPGPKVAFIRFFQEAKLLLHRSIIWAKAGFVLTRSGMYHWAHEPCFYGWRQGDQPPWYGPKNQRSVWTVERDADKGMHPTSKPAELWAIAMRNHLQKGEVALDFCAGSGPVFIAAESLGCVARGCELEPKYAAVILERMTSRGCTAKLVG